MSRGTHPKVYVGGLGDEGKKEEIERAFEKFGPLHDVWVARNPPGFAFVEFEDLRDAEDAVKALDGKTICGMQVRVEMSRHPGGRGRGGGGGGGYRGGRRDDRYDRYDNRSRSPYRWVFCYLSLHLTPLKVEMLTLYNFKNLICSVSLWNFILNFLFTSPRILSSLLLQ